MAAILLSAGVGLILGFAQSLLIGIWAGSLSGGTGYLWGLITGGISALVAVFFGWLGIAAAVAIPIAVLLMSVVSILRDR